MVLTEMEIAFRQRWYMNIKIMDFLRRQFCCGIDGRMFVREMVFLDKHILGKERRPTRRLMLGYTEGFIKANMDKFKFIEEDYCLFHSLMFFDKIPMATWDLKKRKIQQDEWFGKPGPQGIGGDYLKHQHTYEFVLDLDGKKDDLSAVIADAKHLSYELDQLNVPYMIKFSGSKGFHFTIPPRFFVDAGLEWTAEIAPDLCSQLAKAVKEKWDLKSIDEGIYDNLRIMRTAYALDTHDGHHHVVLPLKRTELEGFTKEFVYAERWIDKIDTDLRWRGFCLNNQDGNVKELLRLCLR